MGFSTKEVIGDSNKNRFKTGYGQKPECHEARYEWSPWPCHPKRA